MIRPLPTTFGPTRDALQRVAVHVLARRRAALVGKFGLRPAPGGVATPAAGPEHEVLRTDGSLLLRERTGVEAATEVLDLSVATLAAAAAFAEVDLAAPFEAGHDTPPVGDVDATLGIDADAAAALGHWYGFGQRAIDATMAERGPTASPSVAQIWPEHFDLGCDLGTGHGRANLGASPGDGGHPEPYLYVGPWGPERPGDPAFWNAPFGAVLGHGELLASADPVAHATLFFRRGLDLLA